MNILFFDDDPEYFSRIHKILEKAGHTVYAASTYNTTLALLNDSAVKKDIDFAVFDVLIENEQRTGINLFNEIEIHLQRAIPCLFLTVAPEIADNKIPIHTLFCEKTAFIIDRGGLVRQLDRTIEHFNNHISTPINLHKLGNRVFVIKPANWLGKPKDIANTDTPWKVVYLDDIYFIEPFEGMVKIHTTDGVFTFSTTYTSFIKKIKQENLDLEGFVEERKRLINTRKKISHYNAGALYFENYSTPCQLSSVSFILDNIPQIKTGQTPI
ncbi:MAG: hypothetical protein RI894_2324 [Bacteroidota bacterium]|jgi:CheY-like chemotaxis protein